MQESSAKTAKANMDREPTASKPSFTRSNTISLLVAVNASSPPAEDDVSVGFSIVLFILTSILGTVGNVFLLVVLSKEKRLKHNEYLILNLALTDLSGCVISIPLDVTERILHRFPFGEVLCKIVYPLQTVLMAVSVLTLLLMSYERYRLIVTPFKGNIRGKYLGMLIFFTWVGALIFVLPYVMALHLEGTACVETWPDPVASPKIYTLCSFLFLYAVPLAIISMFYTLVAKTLGKGNRFLVHMNFKTRAPFDEVSILQIKNNLRIVKVFVIAVLVFSVCLLPTHVIWIWREFGSGSSHPYVTEMTTFCNILMYANSAINPFIFGSVRILAALEYCRRRGRSRSGEINFKVKRSFSLRTREIVNSEKMADISKAAPTNVPFLDDAVEEKLSVL